MKVRTGAKLAIKGCGAVQIVDANNSKLRLGDVLYVADLHANLVPVNGLVKGRLTWNITGPEMLFYWRDSIIIRVTEREPHELDV